MFGAILLIAVGIGAIKLGAKGLSFEGLPFSDEIRIVGRPAKIIGVICIVLGIGIFGLGVLVLIARFLR